MCGGDENRAIGVSSLANEEPLVIVEARVDVVREVIREDRGDSRDGVVRKGEASLCRGGCGSIRKRTFGAEDGYIRRGWGICGHRRSKVFTSRGGDKDVVGVNGDILVEWSKEESIEDFLSDLGGSGRHHQ
jgi:hypothetical protein